MTRHLGLTREWVARMIRTHGTEFFDPMYDGTNEQAVAEVLAGPPIICTCTCVKAADGSCTGVRPTGGTDGAPS